jgi:hypothetical protein
MLLFPSVNPTTSVMKMLTVPVEIAYQSVHATLHLTVPTKVTDHMLSLLVSVHSFVASPMEKLSVYVVFRIAMDSCVLTSLSLKTVVKNVMSVYALTLSRVGLIAVLGHARPSTTVPTVLKFANLPGHLCHALPIQIVWQISNTV